MVVFFLIRQGNCSYCLDMGCTFLKEHRSVVPNLFAVTDPFEQIISSANPYLKFGPNCPTFLILPCNFKLKSKKKKKKRSSTPTPVRFSGFFRFLRSWWAKKKKMVRDPISRKLPGFPHFTKFFFPFFSHFPNILIFFLIRSFSHFFLEFH